MSASRRAGQLALLLVILATGAAAREASLSAPRPFVSYPLEKVRPAEKPPESSKALVSLAGNESECIGIGLRNDSPQALTISGLRLRPPSGSRSACQAYLAEYYDSKRKSRWFDPPSAKGRWPDPLIPMRLANEEGADSRLCRLPGGWALPPGENRFFVLDFSLPAGSGCISEDWEAEILIDGGESARFDLRIQSFAFDLPRMPAATTACGFHQSGVNAAHAALSSEPFDAEALHRAYLGLLAEHRISVFSPLESAIPYTRTADGSIAFDWSGFDALTGAMLDGSLFPQAPPATSFRMPWSPPGLSPSEIQAYHRDMAAHMRERGWLERMFYYSVDEPLIADYPEIRERYMELKAADPGIRVMITEPYSPSLESFCDIWCPDLPYAGDSLPGLPFFYKGSGPRAEWQLHFPPVFYEWQRRTGKQTWMYVCNTAVMLDFPNLFIDVPAASHRVIPWVMRRYGFMGFLYWTLNYAYGAANDPWKDQDFLLDQGEGNLLYPGLPGRDFVDAHMPVPSLRLKLLREGLEDYEYLAMLDGAGLSAKADALARSIAPSSLAWKRGMGAYAVAREKAARMLEATL
jgi:hypothetical protein